MTELLLSRLIGVLVILVFALPIALTSDEVEAEL
jgi:hypothetical protein